MDEKSFMRDYIGGDDEKFLWRREQLRKAKLLHGDKEEFDIIIKTALKRRWNKKRQFAVVRYAYVTIMEYVGKMLNKRKEDAPEFC